MHLLQPHLHTRRAFLQRAGQLTLAGTALPTALNLAALGDAAAATATDYKALVCVFLYGGNDYANTVVTFDPASYAQYATVRGGVGEAGGGIALARADLQRTLLQPGTPLAEGRQYALHPAMTGLADLFNTGQAAVQLNVGPLVVPLTRAQFNSADRKTYPLPPKLFSHNDQQSVWQSSSPEGSTVGWGGHLGDLALRSNAKSLFTCMSVTGNAVFLSGDSALQYQVSTGGAVRVRAATDNAVYGSRAVKNLLSEMISEPSAHPLENEYVRVMQRSREAEVHVAAALAGSQSGGATPLTTEFPTNNPLADQLKMVARLIQGRDVLGAKRQVFMVSLGGFDLHDNLIAQQPVLMGRVSEAMAAFYRATVELGVAQNVTAFTASDFGRTLTSNGDGSDHGWGGHHLVVGGAVKGRAFYGAPPPVSVGNTGAPQDQWHVGQGRLLPSTSVDQYAATLARWFGVGPLELNGILPNLRQFGAAAGRADYPVDLGFMGMPA
ncbi:MAG: Tat pathway signal protein [Curvibacter sp. RIFCSPHIGHO2_12_FULL_63_18]|uniref:DUF1501 domain-containing protein n=1 Tax=Rhodoferax sp. TaxID=50421 RepID=UPI0008CAE85A|nr:DUF1501 domain-containing protein [Rhodoferax sp.]OGO94270.1 MAG: Tat pathway signal protein [Curvibacter sp. GWA2_63_95]OGP02812.1 MAG: Tat pathway signal protein [Curvibacter sp. RIFCSPHIGHO2_12_FULL_63_18]HCX83045.1 Tat pathway signal protein [Rhodoferax sp.]